MDQKPNKENRVNFDDIDVLNIDMGGGNMYYLNDKPFSGVMVDYTNNIITAEISVVNGSRQGRIAFYYDNGNLQKEYFQKYNRLYGILKEWDEQGNLIREVDCGPKYDPTLDQ